MNSSSPSVDSLPRIGFLASHNGSSMREIVHHINQGKIAAQAQVIISNNKNSPVFEFAREFNIPSYHISRTTHGNDEEVDKALVQACQGCDWIVLSGYMRPIGPHMQHAFSHKIFNIHPSLLPHFSGEGMYGSKIHEAVIAAQAKESGITIHLVHGGYDQGPIQAQRVIPVDPQETAQSLEDKIKAQEPLFFADFMRSLCAPSD